MKKFTILLLLISLAVFAGDDARKGTTGADQLLIPVGARGIATGGAMLAVLDGIESIYYNPAGLSVNPSTEAMFSYMSYLADINVSYFAVSTSLGEFGSIGLSFKTFDFGDIPITTSQFPDGTGSTYSPSFLTAALSYSKGITDRISVGANFKLINETIINTSASGFAIDAGVQYRLNESISLGAALMNIGTNMTYAGDDLVQTTEIPGTFIGSRGGTYEILTESFQLPSYFQMSFAYNYSFNEQNNFTVASTYTANNSYEDVMNFGLEYGFIGTFFLRGGYNFAVENTDDSIFGFTAGAGIDYRISQDIGLVFDYAFRDVKEFAQANHIMTVKLRFLN